MPTLLYGALVGLGDFAKGPGRAPIAGVPSGRVFHAFATLICLFAEQRFTRLPGGPKWTSP